MKISLEMIWRKSEAEWLIISTFSVQTLISSHKPSLKITKTFVKLHFITLLSQTTTIHSFTEPNLKTSVSPFRTFRLGSNYFCRGLIACTLVYLELRLNSDPFLFWIKGFFKKIKNCQD